MNGICELRVDGKVYPLKFGMLATEELTKRIVVNPNGSNLKSVMDLIYCGLMNYAVVKEAKIKPYSEVVDLVEDFAAEPDFNEQLEAVWNCFNESKHGAAWRKALEALNKKKDEPKETEPIGS